MGVYYEDYNSEQLKNCIDSKARTINNMTELLQAIQTQMGVLAIESKKFEREYKNLMLNRLYWRDRFEDLHGKAEVSGIDVEKIDDEFSENYNDFTAHDLTPDQIIDMWANGEG